MVPSSAWPNVDHMTSPRFGFFRVRPATCPLLACCHCIHYCCESASTLIIVCVSQVPPTTHNACLKCFRGNQFLIQFLCTSESNWMYARTLTSTSFLHICLPVLLCDRQTPLSYPPVLCTPSASSMTSDLHSCSNSHT